MMELFNPNKELFKRSSTAKMSKRFVCCVIDMIFVMLLTSLVFSAIFKIVENTNEYKKEKDIVTYEVNYYKELI